MSSQNPEILTENIFLKEQITSLKIAAADYAKAAEASAVLVEKLTQERDEAQIESAKWKNLINMNPESAWGQVCELDKEVTALRRKLALAEDAAKKGEAARLNAAGLEEGIKELMRELAEAHVANETGYGRYNEAHAQLLQWQAVAGKMREALGIAFNKAKFHHDWSIVNDELCAAALSTPPPTASETFKHNNPQF